MMSVHSLEEFLGELAIGLGGKFTVYQKLHNNSYEIMYRHNNNGFVYSLELAYRLKNQEVMHELEEFLLKLVKDLVPQNRNFRLGDHTENCSHCAAPRTLGKGCQFCGAGL